MTNLNYKETVERLERLSNFAYKLSIDTSGRAVDTRREKSGSDIFTKICLHLNSILRITPHSSYFKRNNKYNILDSSSIAALARCFIESYYVFYYLIIDDISDSDIEFRFLLWDYHSENRRLKIVDLFGSTNPKIDEIKNDIVGLKNKIKLHPNFNKFESRYKRKIIKGDVPFLLSNTKIAEKAGINKNYHKSIYIYLSSYTHTFPLSISQIVAISNTSEILKLCKFILGLITGYLSFSIRDFIKIAPDQKVYLVNEIQEIIDIWEYNFKHLGKYDPVNPEKIKNSK